ncbi:hypothetical protein A3J43_03475 [Candidatus Uhrbacteria bacterium RIFCSPHIGHO2_12_FULL_54_23]|uniref:Magnesium transport protein CorA n=3 Tax=Candidatus Uhriibacteriota TaxID=1752732 RepID=A0A1F7UNA4_9BACT|nr:MAG: hypothetical protein A3J43_03475 [Candidatus Uhrbacteria bacterium RIFCSPHIGHO2_12_FULL_54_23]OGL85143.1 MAG: hypothetical protein A3B36_02225 [Candidatus Uhrbacteria bacterium RIFCSPLOWO2_01_FULL_55_36]OGL91225.1 MAG: hypothetical protein A3J36_02185 [Candidatus Uhrbacteria bacterium RIFCSPLOWO2_02_FULL_54_37]
MAALQELHTKRLRWIDIPRFGEDELEALRKEFDFHPLDLKACLPPLQRPRLVSYPEYSFMILQFPVYDRNSRKIVAVEVDLFIGKDFLISVHDGKHPAIGEFFAQCRQEISIRNNHLGESVPALLYELLNRLLASVFPMLNHVSQDIDGAEDHILSEDQQTVITELLILKRNIVNFRKIMQAHKHVIEKLVENHALPLSAAKLRLYFKGLIEQTKEIWDTLANYQDTVNALHDAHASLINTKSNQAVRILSAIAVITFPLTLIAAVFAMRTEGMPFVNHPHSFWYVVSGMALLASTMMILFKRRKWL